MSRRSGTTLVEVLVAIFVMGIGLIALLTLFPIGILRMGFALNQQRAQDAARNADAVAVFNNIRNDVSTAVYPGPSVLADGLNGPNFDYFSNPGGGLPNADPYGASYPIFVDPLGYASFGGLSQKWVGGVTGVLARRPVSFAFPSVTKANGGLPVLYSNFTLWDDMVFEGALVAGQPSPGTPQQVVLGTVTRDSRFSWAYTMRRPMTSEKGVVDCSIVVFDGRSLSVAAGAGLTFSEQVYHNTAYFNPANGTITINYSGQPFGPPIRAGDWIMDATSIPQVSAAGKINWNSAQGAHAFWYRVVAAEDLVVNGAKLARFEVQQPIRGFGMPLGFLQGANAGYLENPAPNPLPYNAADPTIPGAVAKTVYQGTIIFMDAVYEVFEKGPARLP